MASGGVAQQVPQINVLPNQETYSTAPLTTNVPPFRDAKLKPGPPLEGVRAPPNSSLEAQS